MMTIEMDTRTIDRALDQLGVDLSDGRVPLRRFYQWFRATCLKAWTARAEGGDFRGRRWRALAPQYRRKTDNVTVPAWGGVPRIREGFKKAAKWTETLVNGKAKKIRRNVSTGERMQKVSGTVSGRLRKSGNRVKTTSIILRDTGELARWLFPPTVPPVLTPALMQIGGEVPDWRAEQLERWPVLFFLPSDQERFQQFGDEYVAEVIKKRGLDRAA